MLEDEGDVLVKMPSPHKLSGPTAGLLVAHLYAPPSSAVAGRLVMRRRRLHVRDTTFPIDRQSESVHPCRILTFVTFGG